MGEKRKENYDDWWRCEIRFDPVLDEAFGLTHTKQEIKPDESLTAALSTDLESIARSLNARVRDAHQRIKAAAGAHLAESIAINREHLLTPLAARRSVAMRREVEQNLATIVPELSLSRNEQSVGGRTTYRILEATLSDTHFYYCAQSGNQVFIVINSQHPFYRRLYHPLCESESSEAKQLRCSLELTLIAAARAELSSPARSSSSHPIRHYRKKWSDILATYLNR